MTLYQGERNERAEFLLARTDDSRDTPNANASGTDGNPSDKVAVAAARGGDGGPANGNENGGRKMENGTGIAGEADLSGGGEEGGLAVDETGGGSGGGGARQEQLASLLCKAEQYSMFIRQSQVMISLGVGCGRGQGAQGKGGVG